MQVIQVLPHSSVRGTGREGGREGRAVRHAWQRLGNSLLIRHMSWLLPVPAGQEIPFGFFAELGPQIPLRIYLQMPSSQALGAATADPAFQVNHSVPLPSITIPSLPMRKVLLPVSACPGPPHCTAQGTEAVLFMKCVGKGGAWPLVGADRCKLPVSSRKSPRAFVSPLPLAAAADHPSPGSHHPGDAQLPGLRLPGDRSRLQHGCALPFTMVSRGTSEPLVRQGGGEGYRESTAHDVPRLPICSIQQLLGCGGTCGGETGKGCGHDPWSPSSIVQSAFGFSSRTPVIAQGAVFLLFFRSSCRTLSVRHSLPCLPKAEDRHETVSRVGFCKGFLSLSAAWRGLGAAAAEFGQHWRGCCWRGCHRHVCGTVCPQVHAARYGGRLHAEEPQLPQPGGSLLLVLRLLQQVCRWPCCGNIDTEFTVSPKHYLPYFVSPVQALSTAVF